MHFIFKYQYFRLLFFFIAFLTILSKNSYSIKSDTVFVTLEWQGVKSYAFNENEKIRYISFRGSVYNDDFTGIEAYHHKLPIELPHFKPKINLIPLETIDVSEDVNAFLSDNNFEKKDFFERTKVGSSRKDYFLEYFLTPIRYNVEKGTFEKLVSFKLAYEYHFDEGLKYGTIHEYADNSVLSGGDWYKLCLEETGIYKLDYNHLVELGINPEQVQKSSIAIYGNGGAMLPESNSEPRPDDLIENAVYISGGSGNFGQNDYILFYGQSPHQWSFNSDDELFYHQVHLYSDETCYFLTTTASNGKRIGTRQSLNESPSHNISSFQDYTYHQRDLHNLIESGRIWFGEVFDVTLSREFNFSLPNLIQTESAYINVNVAARSGVQSSFSVKSGNYETSISIPSINPSATGSAYYARNKSKIMEITPGLSNNINVELVYNRTVSGSRGWLNYIAINATRELQFTSPQMAFRNVHNIGSNNISEYTISNANNQLVIWDITDQYNIVNQSYNLSGNNATFTVDTDELKEFIAFDGSSYMSPSLRGQIENQNLHAISDVDMIIVCHEKFYDEAIRLAEFRLENDGIVSRVVTTQQVYNEFSSGIQDISAIRNFMKMFYDRAVGNNYPKYLLLFGNGTYDNKDILGYGGNYIPTFQTKESLHTGGSWITDDYFGILGDHEGEGAQGWLDVGIGRFPVRSADQAEATVNKIIRYDKRIDGWEPGSDDLDWVGKVSNYADWRNMITLIADDQDNNIHFNDSETLSQILESDFPVYNVEKIYLDAYEQITMAGGSRYPEVNKAINSRVNQGALLINYIGHGGRLGLAHERVVTFDDINTWNNYYNMPVFLTATCEFSAFDIASPGDLSAGVRIFLRNNGGAIALFTSTRLAWSGSNLVLNERFFNNAFKPMENGEMPRLGDLIRLSKTDNDRVKNFVLLGDPSMRMAYPEFNVVTESVPDTIRAFEKVEISGYITDNNGNPVNNYNGVIYPKVFDKKKEFTTLGNDPDSSPATFAMQNSLIYRGKASVNNGHFSFSFIVPKDINYLYGKGKLSYYADNGLVDASGFYNEFTIGGTAENYTPDYTGPEIRLFINDTTFVSGDETHENPLLIGFLYDESGINLTGNIGHDLVAFLNVDRANSYVLNNYYEADLDTYKSGKFAYPFNNIPVGRHTISVRAWDTFNNYSEESIDFIVTDAPEMALYDIINYPNPFTSNTFFKFRHNIQSEELKVTINIYNIKGQLVKKFEREILSFYDESPPIEWDGRDMNGRPINSGMYVYRINVETQDGITISGSSTMVVVR